ncbi:MAG TPA: hypothetical protein VIY73_18390 [Polyangiaceae bacterium]
MATMGWEGRLREMLLAGGALAVGGCSSSAPSVFPDASADRDATQGEQHASSDAEQVNFCCNASPDPCCQMNFCDASMSAACACALDGGSWNYPPGVPGGACVVLDAAVDAGPTPEAGPDGDAHD